MKQRWYWDQGFVIETLNEKGIVVARTHRRVSEAEREQVASWPLERQQQWFAYHSENAEYFPKQFSIQQDDLEEIA